jgi:hypothetical protein
MANFEQEFNYDDVFWRDITVAFTSLLYNKIKLVNKYEDGKEKILSLPFYYNFVGDDRFLLDAFVDDVTGVRPDMSIDPIPRGTVTMASWGRKTNEITNPNVRLQTYREVDGQLQKVSGYFRVIPVKFTFDVAIIVASEIDMWRVSEELLKLYHTHKFFRFEHKFMPINASVIFPDTHNTEIQRQIMGIDSDGSNKSIKFSVDVHSHYIIDPKESEVISTDKKVVFKGNTWFMKMKNTKRKWLGTDE